MSQDVSVLVFWHEQQAGSAASVPPGSPYISEHCTGAGRVARGGYMLTLLCGHDCLDWQVVFAVLSFLSPGQLRVSQLTVYVL